MLLRKSHPKPVGMAQRLHEKNEITGKVLPSKGSHRRKYIAAIVENGKEYFLHATKGWRAVKV